MSCLPKTLNSWWNLIKQIAQMDSAWSKTYIYQSWLARNSALLFKCAFSIFGSLLIKRDILGLRIDRRVVVVILYSSTNSSCPYLVRFFWYHSAHFVKLPNKAISCGWIHSKLDQRVSRHSMIINYSSDHLIWRSMEGETAGSMYFDGPSVPSENCISSCSPATAPIA